MNTKHFDWDLVRSFLAALEHGSLLGAAKALKSSQPTLGRHIAELENQLGVPLFERTGRGLRPTAMALSVAESARQMEQAAFSLSQGLAKAQVNLAGTVRLTASTTVATYLLPELLAQMREVLPDIQIEVVSSNAVSNLLRREADIALRMVPPKQSSLIARRVGAVGLGSYAHKRYVQRHGVPLEPMDLLKHNVIGHDQDDILIRGFSHFGLNLTPEFFPVRCDDFVAYWHLVRSGLGIGFVADYVARTDSEVVPVLPQLVIPPLPMWLAVHREIRSTPRIRAVFDFLAETLPQVLI
jgi:DNA-binding transcriptional LysR family regulator